MKSTLAQNKKVIYLSVMLHTEDTPPHTHIDTYAMVINGVCRGVVLLCEKRV